MSIKKTKKVTKKLTKAKVWPLFSKFIRLRDCIDTTGTMTHGRCVTCNEKLPIEKLQAGHLLDGRGGSILFNDECCFAQCYRCNCILHGNKERYIPWFLDTFGKQKYDELLRLKGKPKKWTQQDLEELQKKLKKDIDYLIAL
jgi:hypothetical protein